MAFRYMIHQNLILPIAFLTKNEANSPIPHVMASDMFFAGIETTGNAIGFLLYNLSVNQVI